jgi:hypothetical protein
MAEQTIDMLRVIRQPATERELLNLLREIRQDLSRLVAFEQERVALDQAQADFARLLMAQAAPADDMPAPFEDYRENGTVQPSGVYGHDVLIGGSWQSASPAQEQAITVMQRNRGRR